MAWTEKLPSGRYRGCYRDARGERRYLRGTFTQRAEALRKASAKEDEQRQPGSVDARAGRITWGAWFPEWMEAHSIAHSTETEYRSIAKNHILPSWGDVELADITTLGARKWVKTLTREGRSPYTIRVAVQVMSASLNAALGTRLTVNPMKGVRWPDLPDGVERFLTPPEVEAITFHMDRLNATIVWTAVSSGMRMGELAGLHMRRLDLGRGVIDVIEQYDQKARVIKPLPKDKEKRHVPIPPDVVEMLVDLTEGKSTRGSCGFPHLSGRCPGGELVFVGPRNSPLTSREWGRGPWKKALESAGIEGRVRPHDLRHTFASWLIQQGVSFAELARVMGHSSWEVTKRYAHLADEGYDSVRSAIAAKMETRRGAENGAEVGFTALQGAVSELTEEAV